MINLTAFVKQNGPQMTLTQLVEESGATITEVRKKLNELEIEPPTSSEVIKRYILCHPNMSLERMLKVLDCTPTYLQTLYKEMGMIVKVGKKALKQEKMEEIDKDKGERLSVSQILASFKQNDSIHYPDHLLKRR